MTVLLEQAFSKAASLPALEQNRFAEWILEELADEKKWDDTFADSQSLLETLASEAMNEHRAGKTVGIDELLK